MMLSAKGPLWHQKQKKENIIPEGLRGVDREATWSFSRADGWVYGHGSFMLCSHRVPVVGLFVYMPNSAHEAKRMESEIRAFKEEVTMVCMDSKADDQGIYYRLKQDHIQLLTAARRGCDKTPSRRQMIAEMGCKRALYRERSITVEPMQGLVADIFDLEHCWMRGEVNNRWLFAAMGVAVQMAQEQAFEAQQSTWKVKHRVLGSG